MGKQFILVEGINLYANLYDTHQLSVIRGTSFLFKDAIRYIGQHFEKQLKPISTGASSGLFLLKENATKSVEAIAADIKQELQTEGDFRYLTFGIVCTEQDDLQAAKEQLIAQLRFQQLQQLQILPDLNPGAEPCSLSGSRIASSGQPKLKGKPVAASIFQRWRYGRNKKYSYYSELIADTDTGKIDPELEQRLKDYRFANNVEILCADPNQPLDRNDEPTRTDQPLMYPKLARKMALVYIDGNKFGDHQRNFIQQQTDQIDAQQKFDGHIKDSRNRFLSEIVRDLAANEREAGENPLDDEFEQAKVLRLETLLWGGDEMTFIMPAWEGFDFLQRFFAFDWTLPSPDSTPLTHSVGIVFCQAKTPVRIIDKLARQLVDRVKAHDRSRNGWDYLVLESVDYPTNETLDGYFADRYQPILAKLRPCPLPAIGNWNASKTQLQDFLLKRFISRGQLYQIVSTIKQTPLGTPTVDGWAEVLKLENAELFLANPQEQAEKRMYEVSKEENKKDLANLKQYACNWFGLDMDCPRERAWLWIHLLELWDYLIPQRNEKQRGKA